MKGSARHSPDRAMGKDAAAVADRRRRVVLSKLSVLTSLPWLVSVLVHLGLFTAMLPFVMVVKAGLQSPPVTVPDAYLADRPGLPMGLAQPRRNGHEPPPKIREGPALLDISAPLRVRPAAADRKDAPAGLGRGGSVAAMARFALTPAGSERPISDFFGTGGDARHIVYVVDRSASMIDTFDNLRHQMLVSIARLRADQHFHVILFAKDEAIENPPKRLVPATKNNKLAAVEFLQQICPEGSTTALAALRRAFEVLGGAAGPPGGKVIHLLTDGAFEGPGVISSGYTLPDGRVLDGNAAVARYIRDRNKNGEIHINTFLYGYHSGEAEEVMKSIAAENGGRFRFVALEQ
ncbi:MAG: VWA domain-containing protein [Phycisphaerae bacterium]|nr:VWA domain-containing protein [Phycisphaerae bacterium]